MNRNRRNLICARRCRFISVHEIDNVNTISPLNITNELQLHYLLLFVCIERNEEEWLPSKHAVAREDEEIVRFSHRSANSNQCSDLDFKFIGYPEEGNVFFLVSLLQLHKNKPIFSPTSFLLLFNSIRSLSNFGFSLFRSLIGWDRLGKFDALFFDGSQYTAAKSTPFVISTIRWCSRSFAVHVLYFCVS